MVEVHQIFAHVRADQSPVNEHGMISQPDLKIPRQCKPVEEYLKLQGRFKHLFHPQRDHQGIAKIQMRDEAYWNNAGLRWTR